MWEIVNAIVAERIDPEHRVRPVAGERDVGQRRRIAGKRAGEIKLIAGQLEYIDPAYRQRILAIFERHVRPVGGDLGADDLAAGPGAHGAPIRYLVHRIRDGRTFTTRRVVAALLDWVKRQATRGAIIVGICDGVPVLANAGLLEGRRATAHWKTIDGLERKHAGTQWLRNQRYVADGNVITTSGVSASIPISVALVEAIAGPERATQLARSLGVQDWSPVHDSSRFRLDAASLFTVLRNKAMFWRHETLGVPVAPGVDEISVALIADAYARTRRTTAVSISASDMPIRTRRGLTLHPDRVSSAPGKPAELLPLHEELPAAQALDRALAGIAARYGDPTAAFVALTMEYPHP